MKKAVLVSLFSLAVIPAFAQASDATINFTGSVVTGTCVVNGGSPTIAVGMPAVQTTALSSSGQTAGTTPFRIALTGCTGNSTVNGQFEVGSTVNTSTGNLRNTDISSDGARNVEVQLLSGSGEVIPVNGSSRVGQITLDGSGAGAFNLFSQYRATGEATAGAVRSSVQFSLIYN